MRATPASSARREGDADAKRQVEWAGITLRIQAEKKGAPEAFIEPDAPQPFERDGRYGLFFSGGDKKTGRMFSCYLSCAKKELITIYLEAVGVAPKEHLASFEAFVTALNRK